MRSEMPQNIPFGVIYSNFWKASYMNILATNEPKRQSCGAPDYILTKKDIPVGFVEAKDIGDDDLDGIRKNGNKEQFDRYKAIS